MALTEPQQAKDVISRATQVLVTFAPQRGGDAVAAALALQLALEKLGKRVDVVATGFSLPGSFRFLPNAKRISDAVGSLRKFVVSVNLEHTELANLSYSVENSKLNMYLTPKQGSFSAADITTRSSNFSYDLIIVVDTPDLSSLGDLFQNNTEFFYQTTIVNIDHAPTNEQFGQVNITNLNVPATCDLIFDLLQELDTHVIDEDIATCLLTGLTSATRSFKSNQVTPDTLTRASRLVSLGARREEVVTHLYRTKQLPTLKLWGRALARLKSDSARKLVWTVLQPDDFVKAGASEEELSGVIDELIVNAPEAGTVVLLYEVSSGTTNIFLQSGPGQHALDLLKPFTPTGDRLRAQAKLAGKSVLEAEKLVIERLKELIRPLE